MDDGLTSLSGNAMAGYTTGVVGGVSLATHTNTKMYLTFINIEVSGDTFFPKWDKNEWEEVSRESFKNEMKEIDYSFVEFNRRLL